MPTAAEEIKIISESPDDEQVVDTIVNTVNPETVEYLLVNKTPGRAELVFNENLEGFYPILCKHAESVPPPTYSWQTTVLHGGTHSSILC